MQKEGKRAIRDVKGMGIAGGWLVLGVGWTVDAELQRQVNVPTVTACIRMPTQRKEIMFELREGGDSTDDDMIFMGSQAKTRSIPARVKKPEAVGADGDSDASAAISQHPSTSDVQSETTSTADTAESIFLKTPFSETGGQQRDFASEVDTLNLIVRARAGKAEILVRLSPTPSKPVPPLSYPSLGPGIFASYCVYKASLRASTNWRFAKGPKCVGAWSCRRQQAFAAEQSA